MKCILIVRFIFLFHFIYYFSLGDNGCSKIRIEIKIWLIDWLIDGEANGTENEKTDSLPASDLDHLLSNFLLERMQEKRRRMQASNSFQFWAPLTAILNWEEISAFNILKHSKLEASRKVFVAKQSHVLTSTAKELD